ncbi:MAG: SAM-dependent methyltransferase [Clostridia bacterium]|nr:SAM-dependent methyltransferase [Clostridia bacterium]
MNEYKISKRLCTASSHVRDGAVVADIGTDHAYLPIYLARHGRIKKAYACDLNEGPIQRAKENISKYNLDDIIEVRLQNGLDGIEALAPTDIVICGMGGELIASILDNSSYVRQKGIRLILQPMTFVKELRKYLENGFSTIAENAICEDGKIYQLMCVEYDGTQKTLSNVELELGPKNLINKGIEFEKLLFSTIAKKQKILNGLRLGGYDTTQIEEEISELEKLK